MTFGTWNLASAANSLSASNDLMPNLDLVSSRNSSAVGAFKEIETVSKRPSSCGVMSSP